MLAAQIICRVDDTLWADSVISIIGSIACGLSIAHTEY